MEDFAAKVIAAHQAGLSEYKQQQLLEQQAEEHKLNVQQRKLELDTAKLQQAMHERTIQGLTSGGPTGQATTSIQTPTVQPANIPAPPVSPIPNAPAQPQSIADLLMRGRQQAQPQMAPIPSGQDTGLNHSIETGTPPVGPDIPVQLSDGRTITVPGTNLEREQALAVQQLIQQETLKRAFGPNQIVPKGGSIASPTGQIISQGAPDLPALFEEVAAVTPGFDAMSGPQKLQAVANYKRQTDKPTTPSVEEQALQAYLKKYPGKTALDYENDKAARAQNAANANIQGALKNVAPHLVLPATQAFEKDSKDYADAVNAQNNIQSVLDDAAAGNKVAYSYAPAEGAIYMQTSQGIKRMNTAEMVAFGGAGSAWQRIQAWLGKQATGESIPPEILKDMKSLAASIGSNARRNYENKIKVTNAGFGSTFSPIDFGNSAAGGSTNGSASKTGIGPATQRLIDKYK